jgi:tellurite resistance protein TehA-like permease
MTATEDIQRHMSHLQLHIFWDFMLCQLTKQLLMFGRWALYQSSHSFDWAHPYHGCSKRSLTFMNKWDVSLNVCPYHPKGKNTLLQWELN